MAKTTEYQIQAKLNLLVAIPINAGSLAEAIQKAADFKEEDFVTTEGECIGGDFKITGAYQSEPY